MLPLPSCFLLILSFFLFLFHSFSYFLKAFSYLFLLSILSFFVLPCLPCSSSSSCFLLISVFFYLSVLLSYLLCPPSYFRPLLFPSSSFFIFLFIFYSCFFTCSCSTLFLISLSSVSLCIFFLLLYLLHYLFSLNFFIFFVLLSQLLFPSTHSQLFFVRKACFVKNICPCKRVQYERCVD